jgi:hypothetical protein
MDACIIDDALAARVRTGQVNVGCGMWNAAAVRVRYGQAVQVQCRTARYIISACGVIKGSNKVGCTYIHMYIAGNFIYVCTQRMHTARYVKYVAGFFRCPYALKSELL